MVVGRRSYDLIRFISADRQKIVNGIGARRFGFFDQYVVANDSVQALDIIGRMPINQLHNTVVLENDPAQILPDSKGIKRVDLTDISLSPDLVRGSHQKMKDYYDSLQKVYFDDSSTQDEDGYLHFPLDQNDLAGKWSWDKNNIGYFHVLFGQAEKSNYYNPFNYFPNPGIRTGYNSKEDGVCYADFSEWITKHVLPGFYKVTYDAHPNVCDILVKENELLVSPEIRGAFYTDDMSDSERDNFIDGFYLASLDPKKVTPDRSPYPRDEPTVVKEFGPNSITFAINNSKPGLFYYADSYANDWKAYLDESSTTIFRANFNFKAIYVPAGEHVLSIKYKPNIFIFIAWAFILISIPGLAIPVRALVSAAREK